MNDYADSLRRRIAARAAVLEDTQEEQISTTQELLKARDELLKAQRLVDTLEYRLEVLAWELERMSSDHTYLVERLTSYERIEALPQEGEP